MTTNNKPVLDNHTYDVAKKAVMITLPAIATLYFALAQIWHFPASDQVIASITAISTALGIVLNKFSKNYNDVDENFGATILANTTEDGRKVFQLEFKSEEAVDQVYNSDKALVKINRV